MNDEPEDFDDDDGNEEGEDELVIGEEGEEEIWEEKKSHSPTKFISRAKTDTRKKGAYEGESTSKVSTACTNGNIDD